MYRSTELPYWYTSPPNGRLHSTGKVEFPPAGRQAGDKPSIASSGKRAPFLKSMNDLQHYSFQSKVPMDKGLHTPLMVKQPANNEEITV